MEDEYLIAYYIRGRFQGSICMDSDIVDNALRGNNFDIEYIEGNPEQLFSMATYGLKKAKTKLQKLIAKNILWEIELIASYLFPISKWYNDSIEPDLHVAEGLDDVMMIATPALTIKPCENKKPCLCGQCQVKRSLNQKIERD